MDLPSWLEVLNAEARELEEKISENVSKLIKLFNVRNKTKGGK